MVSHTRTSAHARTSGTGRWMVPAILAIDLCWGVGMAALTLSGLPQPAPIILATLTAVCMVAAPIPAIILTRTGTGHGGRGEGNEGRRRRTRHGRHH